MAWVTQTSPPNKTPLRSKPATTRTPPKSAAHAANCQASVLRSEPTQHLRAAAVATPLALDRHRAVAASPRVDAVPRPAVAATALPGHVGAMAKHRLTHRAVKAGHQKIVVARHASAKAETIRVVAIAPRAMARHVRARPVVMRVRRARRALPAQVVVRAIAARHRPVAAAATAVAVATAAAAATTVAITVVEPVAVAVDQVMAVVAAPAATVVKVMAHHAHVGASVASLHKAAVVLTMGTAAIQVGAALAMTVAHLRRVLRTVAVTMRAALIVRRAQVVVVVAGAIAMA